MAKNRESYKRPCNQCRLEVGNELRRQAVETNYSLRWANCCGTWVFSYKSDKLAWRRPNYSERIGDPNDYARL